MARLLSALWISFAVVAYANSDYPACTKCKCGFNYKPDGSLTYVTYNLGKGNLTDAGCKKYCHALPIKYFNVTCSWNPSEGCNGVDCSFEHLSCDAYRTQGTCSGAIGHCLSSVVSGTRADECTGCFECKCKYATGVVTRKYYERTDYATCKRLCDAPGFGNHTKEIYSCGGFSRCYPPSCPSGCDSHGVRQCPINNNGCHGDLSCTCPLESFSLPTCNP